MDHSNHTIKLYSPQTPVVIDTLMRDGVCYSRRVFVEKKYGESAKIFLAAYDWFVKEAKKYTACPADAEYPYWAFKDADSVDGSAGAFPLLLDVPVDSAVFFDMYDWNKILNLQYIGTSEADEKRFGELLSDYGIRNRSDIILTGFYPDLKQQILDSWTRLFRHHEAIRSGDCTGVLKVQAALWQIRRSWIVPAETSPDAKIFRL